MLKSTKLPYWTNQVVYYILPTTDQGMCLTCIQPMLLTPMLHNDELVFPLQLKMTRLQRCMIQYATRSPCPALCVTAGRHS